MVLQIFSGFQSSTSVTVNLLSADDALVTNTGTVVSTVAVGINADGSGQSATIYGSVYGETRGIYFGSSSDATSGNEIFIGTTGNVTSANIGIKMIGHDGVVMNHGIIKGRVTGIDFGGSGTGYSLIYNDGAIHGRTDAIIRDSSGDTEKLVIRNHGLIDGGLTGDAFESNGANAVERLVNAGRINGDLSFGLGNDVYDGRNGTINGDILGGDGKDSLSGGTGAETFIGGAGVDALAGGTGNDHFVFLAKADAGDFITDFSNVTGNNDVIDVTAAAFGGAIPLGQLSETRFHTGTTNAAVNASERFVFRTSDTTLWFDSDGNGAVAPILLAHVQAGVLLTAADIFLI